MLVYILEFEVHFVQVSRRSKYVMNEDFFFDVLYFQGYIMG